VGTTGDEAGPLLPVLSRGKGRVFLFTPVQDDGRARRGDGPGVRLPVAPGGTTRRDFGVSGVVLALLLVASWALARPASAQQGPIRVRDDRGRNLVLSSPPARVVSLVPSVTELIYAIGAGDRVAGRTRWDDQPPAVRSVPSVGDAIGASVERVVALRPDLIILAAGADDARTVAEMERVGVSVFVVDLNTLSDLDRVIHRLGFMLARRAAADSLARAIREELRAVHASVRGLPVRSVYYDVAWPPPITIGAGSYLDELLEIAGARNVFEDLAAPSPRVGLESVVARNPDLILVPVIEGGPEPVPPARRPGWEAIEAVRDGAVVRVDASALHRLGPRIGIAARRLAAAIHPEAGNPSRGVR
jgi:ABC-type Fe3+-hydroxamate transport system substrate-binding protein